MFTSNNAMQIKIYLRHVQIFFGAEDKQQEYATLVAKYVNKTDVIRQIHRDVKNNDIEKDVLVNIPIKETSDEAEELYVSMQQTLSDLKDFAYELNEDIKAEREDVVLEHGKVQSMVMKNRGFQQMYAKPGASATSNHGRVMAAAAPSPIKLEKASAISFSGEHRDFATFLRDFRTIVIPDRPDTEIGLRLR